MSVSKPIVEQVSVKPSKPLPSKGTGKRKPEATASTKVGSTSIGATSKKGKKEQVIDEPVEEVEEEEQAFETQEASEKKEEEEAQQPQDQKAKVHTEALQGNFYKGNFKDDLNIEKFNTHFVNLHVKGGRVCNMESLKERNFDLEDRLQHQGWLKYLKLSEPFYSQMVRVFYSNAKVIEIKSKPPRREIISYVKGKNIVLSPEVLEELFNMPSSRVAYKKEVPKNPQYQGEKCWGLEEVIGLSKRGVNWP